MRLIRRVQSPNLVSNSSSYGQSAAPLRLESGPVRSKAEIVKFNDSLREQSFADSWILICKQRFSARGKRWQERTCRLDRDLIHSMCGPIDHTHQSAIAGFFGFEYLHVISINFTSGYQHPAIIFGFCKSITTSPCSDTDILLFPSPPSQEATCIQTGHLKEICYFDRE